MSATVRIAALAMLAALASPLPAAGQSDETCIAYMEADAAYEAAKREAWAEWNAARKPAFEAYEAAKKVLDKPLSAARKDPNSDWWAAVDTHRTALSKANETLLQNAWPPIDARRDTAIDAASEAWGRAYSRAYQGPTSDIQSVFQKLVLADRERCRERFGQ